VPRLHIVNVSSLKIYPWMCLLVPPHAGSIHCRTATLSTQVTASVSIVLSSLEASSAHDFPRFALPARFAALLAIGGRMPGAELPEMLRTRGNFAAYPGRRGM
jgi:hypothetical protein